MAITPRRHIANIFGSTGLKTDPGAGGLPGFPVGVPTLQTQNFLEDQAGQSLLHLEEHGTPTYDALTNYAEDGLALDQGQVWRSLTADNVGNAIPTLTPATDPPTGPTDANWKMDRPALDMADSGLIDLDTLPVAGNFAHGFTRKPILCNVVLVNTDPQAGVSIGDELAFDLVHVNPSGSVESGITVTWDATNVYFSTDSTGLGSIRHRTTSSPIAIDETKWDLRIYVWGW